MIKLLKSFVYAGRGIALCLRERNFRIHLVAVAAVLFFGVRFYDFSSVEWAVLILTMGAVLSLEAVNTAIENLCNRVSTEKNPLIAACKDCAAAAVLISAIAALCVAAVLFWNTDVFAEIWRYFSADIWASLILAASVAAAVAVVFVPEILKK